MTLGSVIGWTIFFVLGWIYIAIAMFFLWRLLDEAVDDNWARSRWDTRFIVEHPDHVFMALFWIVIPLEFGLGNFMALMRGKKHA